jgi:hypothetical protein
MTTSLPATYLYLWSRRPMKDRQILCSKQGASGLYYPIERYKQRGSRLRLQLVVPGISSWVSGWRGRVYVRVKATCLRRKVRLVLVSKLRHHKTCSSPCPCPRLETRNAMPLHTGICSLNNGLDLHCGLQHRDGRSRINLFPVVSPQNAAIFGLLISVNGILTLILPVPGELKADPNMRFFDFPKANAVSIC